MKKVPQIALLGNPNSGKSSLFNLLTGLRQKVGNFPGVTVEKKVGKIKLTNSVDATVVDFPGAYSLYPRRSDEWVSYTELMSPSESEGIDLAVVVVDASNLRRNLLYVSQVVDLKIPVVVALTMTDLAKKRGIRVDVDCLAREMQVPVVVVNARTGKGVEQLLSTVTQVYISDFVKQDFFEIELLGDLAIKETRSLLPTISNYSAVHHLINHESFGLKKEVQDKIEEIEKKHNFNHTRVQAEDIQLRYKKIRNIMQRAVEEDSPEKKKLYSEKIDHYLLHKRWGYLIMGVVLFLLFQSIFWIADYPMTAIESGMGLFGEFVAKNMEKNWFSDLLVNGVLAGLGGILVFVPQIMILFGLITLLEDTGYMARISFLSDRIMRRVGLNGKSVMPMIGGFACAVPAIMSARNIENKKERLLTIMVTPFMSCSARLPVYTILISLVIDNKVYFGFLSLQGIVMMGLYLLGIVMALLASMVLKWFVRIKEKSYFILELPVYRAPRWGNVGVTMVQKAKIFVTDAGKVIMIISLLLWFLSSYGPNKKMEQLEATHTQQVQLHPEQQATLDRIYNTQKLENSYAGILGKSIEPAIAPLGFDWKIGIALITSFAAREVFVGTMATLYSVEADDNNSLTDKLKAAKRPDGTAVYSLAAAISLMIFYVLAMQCMSTLVIVKRETASWKWPAIQFFMMTGLAYFMSWGAYALLK